MSTVIQQTVLVMILCYLNYLVLPNIDALRKWETIIHELIGYIVQN